MYVWRFHSFSLRNRLRLEEHRRMSRSADQYECIVKKKRKFSRNMLQKSKSSLSKVCQWHMGGRLTIGRYAVVE